MNNLSKGIIVLSLLVAMLLLTAPLMGLYSTIIFTTVNIFGMVGHYLFRDYLYTRPDMEKTAMNMILLMLSYGLQNLSTKITVLLVLTCSLDHKVFLDNGLTVCNLTGLSEYFTEYIFLYAFSCFTIIRNWRRFWPSHYIMVDHSLVVKVMVIICLLIGLTHLAVQIGISGNVCDARSVNYIFNQSVLGAPVVPDTVPWFNILTVAIVCIGAVLGSSCMITTILFALYNLVKMKLHARGHEAAAVAAAWETRSKVSVLYNPGGQGGKNNKAFEFEGRAKESNISATLPNTIVEVEPDVPKPPVLISPNPLHRAVAGAILPTSSKLPCCKNPFQE